MYGFDWTEQFDEPRPSKTAQHEYDIYKGRVFSKPGSFNHYIVSHLSASKMLLGLTNLMDRTDVRMVDPAVLMTDWREVYF